MLHSLFLLSGNGTFEIVKRLVYVALTFEPLKHGCTVYVEFEQSLIYSLSHKAQCREGVVCRFGNISKPMFARATNIPCCRNGYATIGKFIDRHLAVASHCAQCLGYIEVLFRLRILCFSYFQLSLLSPLSDVLIG